MPSKLTLKLISIAVVVALLAGGGFYVAWNWRGSIAKEEEAEAISKKVGEIQEAIDSERSDRAKFQSEMADTLKGLNAELGAIRRTGRATAEAIAKERASNPEFYDQPLPQKGRDEWIAARAAASQSPASGPSTLRPSRASSSP